MPDGTVRGGFELSAEQPIRTLHSIRDAGAEADATLKRLGDRMDTLNLKLDRFANRRATATVGLSGFERANAQLSELEARLDRLDRRRSTATVGIGGGFSNLAGGDGGAGGAGGGLFSSLGGMPGRLPWWLAAAPLAPQLIGGAGALIGSAGSAALGAGTMALGGAGALGAGGIPTALIARNAVKDLTAVTKAQTTYNAALQAFGRQSTQAAAAKRRLDLALVAAPAGAAGAARQVSALGQDFSTATRPAYTALYGSIAQGAYSLRGALPTAAPLLNQSASVTGRAGADYVRFLTGTQSLSSYRQLTAGFAQDLPVIERSAQSLTRLFLNLSVDALPFFREGTVWLNNWTRNMANQSQDQVRVQSRMREMVTSARDWEHLLGAAGRDMRDLLGPSVAPGNSMVVQFTNTLDRWDTWLRNNPQKVRSFFSDAVSGTSRIATIIGNLTGDVWQIFRALNPILTRAEQFISFASGLGGGNLAIGAGLLYGGYQGARGALGGRGPGAGGLLSSFILGGPGGLVRTGGRMGGGGVVGGGAAMSTLGRASNLEVARGVTGGGAFLMGPATVGFDAVLARRAAAREAPAGLFSRVGARVGGVVEGSPAAARAADFLGSAGAGVAGAARGIAPIYMGLAALSAIGQATAARGGVGSHLLAGIGGGLSALSFGAIPAHFMAAPPVGFDSPSVQAENRRVAAQAGAVRTPAQLAAVMRTITPGISLARSNLASGFGSAGDARKLQAFLMQAAQTAASNAGAAASNTWQQSFTRGLTTMGPNRSVTTMLGGIGSQLRQLGPTGGRALAADTAQWANQLVLADPRLEAPVSRLMRGIVGDVNKMNHTVGTSMQDLRDKIFYFNGQILQGSTVTWGKISSALTNPVQVAQEKMSGIFGTIQREAIDALTGMGYTRSQARAVVTAASSGGQNAQNANLAVQTTSRTGQATTPLVQGGASGLPRRGRARGGMISGTGLLDTVMTPDGGLAAPGEAWIANRHTMNALSSATLAKFGKTAWQMIRDEGRPHSAPPRYRAATGTAGLPPIIQAGGVSGHPELHSGISRAVSAVLGMFPGLQITSTTGGGHAKGSYHYLGEAADVASDAGTMFRAAAWINSSGLARQLTEGIHNPNLSVKFGRGVSPSYWGAPTWAEHLNHIHMAVAGGANVGALAGGAVGGGGASGMLARPISLRAPRSNMAGVPGALLDAASSAITLGMQQAVNRRSGAVGISGAGFTGGGSSRANQSLGQRMMLAAGWPMSEWPSLLKLWNQESGWSANAVNRSSGAYGIPQSLGHGHPYNLGDAPGQIAWGLNYIRGRYGSPSGAWAHEVSHNWYQRGGRLNWAGWNASGGDFVTHGPTMFGAGEKGRERVSITPVGRGSRGKIVVNFNGPVYARDAKEVEQLGEMVAGKILDALDRVGAGTSDGELMSGAA